MISVSSLVLSILCGFAIPYMASSLFSPAIRTVIASGERSSGAVFAVQWLGAFICGPALMVARLMEIAREGEEAWQDIGLGLLAVTGWAALYGFVLLTLVSRTIT